MKARLFTMLAAVLLSVSALAQSDFALASFDHEVTQPAPGGNTTDGGPQAVSNITSVAGVPLVRLNNGVMMPRFGLGTGTVAEGWIDDAVRFWENQSGVTGIRQARASKAKENAIYSPDGTRHDTLQKGINIVNNKKIFK